MIITRVTGTAIAHRNFDCLVEIQTDEGISGIAIGTSDAGTGAQQLGSDVLVGEDPRAVVALWQKMQSGQPDPRSIALLDLAIWDMKAKINGEPLWKTLGAARPCANAYLSIDGSLPESEMVQRYGFHEGKLSVSTDIASDAMQLEMLRDALSKNAAYPALMIDAGDRWTPEQAISSINVLEKELDLTWVQCKDSAWSKNELRQISDSVSAAVCTGSFSASKPHAADIVELDLLATGITESLQIADAAYGFELPVTLSATPGNIAAHVASAMPNFMSMEIPDWTLSDAMECDVVIENGNACVGDKPGLGLAGAAE